MDQESQQHKLVPGARFDAVLVPGGGVREDAGLPPWVEARLEAALQAAYGCPIVTLSAGTTHKAPPRDLAGWPILESVAMARYLQARGYPAQLLWPETASYDAIGNAFFARTIHIEPAGLRNLLVITSEFHLPRAEKIFRWIFSLNPPMPGYTLSFLGTANTGLSPEVLDERIDKERTSLASLDSLIAQHRSMASLHHWIFTEHAAYAVAKAKTASQIPAKLSESY